MQPLRFQADSCSLGSPALPGDCSSQDSSLPFRHTANGKFIQLECMNRILILIVISSVAQAVADLAARSRFTRLKSLLFALLCGRLAGLSLGLLAQTESYAGALLPTLCLALGCCVTVLLAEALGSGRPGAPPQSGLSLSALFLLPLSLLAVCMAPSLTSPIPAALFALSAAYTVLYPLFLDRAPAPAAVRRSSLAAAAWPLRGCMSMIPLTCMICRAVAESGLRPYYEAFWTGIQCGSLLFVTLCYAVPLIVRSYPGKLPFLLLTLGFGSGLLLPF